MQQKTWTAYLRRGAHTYFLERTIKPLGRVLIYRDVWFDKERKAVRSPEGTVGGQQSPRAPLVLGKNEKNSNKKKTQAGGLDNKWDWAVRPYDIVQEELRNAEELLLRVQVE